MNAIRQESERQSTKQTDSVQGVLGSVKPRTTSKKRSLKANNNSASSTNLQSSSFNDSMSVPLPTITGELVNLEEPYLMAKEFLRTFQTNLFVDDEFQALQTCLQLLKLLLTYHAPEIIRHLE